MPKRVLITGATGFIGRHALPALVGRGFEVHALSSQRPRHARATARSPNEVIWHRANLFDAVAMERKVADIDAEYLLHLAWDVEPGEFWTSPQNLRWVSASLDLLLAFHGGGGKRVVIAGTCAEYDWSAAKLFDLGTPLQPTTLYGASKHALHLVLESYAEQVGSSAAWGRVFFIYGPGEAPQRLVPSVVRSLLRGQPAQCTHGNQIRDFLHVADLADAFVALLDSKVEGPVNLASGTGVSIASVVQRIGASLGRPELIELGARPAPEGEPAELRADVTRLRREVKWQPKFDLESGLEDTIAYWRRETGDRTLGDADRTLSR